MGGCRLLYFVKSKNGTKCKNFAVLLCFMSIHSFIIFPEMAGGGGGYSPLSHPTKSATVRPSIVAQLKRVNSAQKGQYYIIVIKPKQ